MRRPRVPALLSALALAAAVGGAWLGPGVLAQEATPTAEEAIPEGVSFEGLGFLVAAELPPAPAEIALFRIGLAPGAVFPIEEEDPSLALAYVETGTVAFVVEAPITVLRAAGPGTPFPEEHEEVAAGTPFELAAGDSALFPPRAAGEARNEGAEAASILVANVFPTGEGGAAATPTP